jgi:hypothetical protein
MRMTRGELNLIRIASTVALGGFLVGFDATVISGAVPFIRDYFYRGGPSGSPNFGWAASCLGWGAMEPCGRPPKRPLWAPKRAAKRMTERSRGSVCS